MEKVITIKANQYTIYSAIKSGLCFVAPYFFVFSLRNIVSKNITFNLILLLVSVVLVTSIEKIVIIFSRKICFAFSERNILVLDEVKGSEIIKIPWCEVSSFQLFRATSTRGLSSLNFVLYLKNGKAKRYVLLLSFKKNDISKDFEDALIENVNYYNTNNDHQIFAGKPVMNLIFFRTVIGILIGCIVASIVILAITGNLFWFIPAFIAFFTILYFSLKRYEGSRADNWLNARLKKQEVI